MSDEELSMGEESKNSIDYRSLQDRVLSLEAKTRILSTYQSDQQRKLESAVEKLSEVAKCLKDNEDTFAKAMGEVRSDIRRTWEDDRHGLIHIGIELTEIRQSVRVATWIATTLGGVALTMAASYFSISIFGVLP